MKKNRVYTVNSLLARISGNYKFWLIALPAVTMLAQAPAVYAHAETITVVQQNNATVRGSVKDATGESLIGVSVTVKGKEGVGTITDVDGNYSIVCSAQRCSRLFLCGICHSGNCCEKSKTIECCLKGGYQGAG